MNGEYVRSDDLIRSEGGKKKKIKINKSGWLIKVTSGLDSRILGSRIRWLTFCSFTGHVSNCEWSRWTAHDPLAMSAVSEMSVRWKRKSWMESSERECMIPGSGHQDPIQRLNLVSIILVILSLGHLNFIHSDMLPHRPHHDPPLDWVNPLLKPLEAINFISVSYRSESIGDEPRPSTDICVSLKWRHLTSCHCYKKPLWSDSPQLF